MDSTTADGGNTGLVARRRYISESRVVEMMGRLHVDLFLQDRFLLKGVSVKIRLAYNGEYSKNPFNAKNNAINFLAVYVDGRQVPAKPLQPNFETGSYIRSYVNLFSATGKQAQDEGDELSRGEFGKGYTVHTVRLITCAFSEFLSDSCSLISTIS